MGIDISKILDALLILGTSPAGTSHGIPGVSENVRQLVEMLPDDVILEVGKRLGIDTSKAGEMSPDLRRMLARSLLQMRSAYTSSPEVRPVFPDMEFPPEDIERALSHTRASRLAPPPAGPAPAGPAPALAPLPVDPVTTPVGPAPALGPEADILRNIAEDQSKPAHIRMKAAEGLRRHLAIRESSHNLPAEYKGIAVRELGLPPAPASPPAGPTPPPSAVPTASSPGRLAGALSALRNTGGPALGGGIATAGLVGMADDALYGRDINPMHAISTGVGTALAGLPEWKSGVKFLPNAGNVLKSGARNVFNLRNVMTALSTMAGQGLGHIAQREGYDLGRGNTDDSTWKHVGALGSGALAGLSTGLTVHPAIAAIANAGSAAGAGAAGALGASMWPAVVIAAILAAAGNYGISHLSENIGRDAADLENSLGSQFAARDKEKYFHDASAEAQEKMKAINDAYINRSTGELLDPSMRESYQSAVRALADEMKGVAGMDDLTMSRVLKEATGGSMYGHYRPEAPPENPLSDRWYSKPLLGLF